MKEYISGKIVLVTGAGGSIGSELCRQIIEYNPSNLIMFDRYENGLFEIDLELNRKVIGNRSEVIGNNTERRGHGSEFIGNGPDVLTSHVSRLNPHVLLLL